MLPNELAQFDDVLGWRAQSRQPAAERAAALLTLSDEDLSPAIVNIPDEELLGVLEYMLDAAHEELDREPKRARRYTDLVLAHIGRVHVPRGAEPFIELLHAQAWKEHGNALHTLGDLPGALTATRQGIGALGANPAYTLERADLELLEAHIHHDQGDWEMALARVRACAAQFRAHGDMRRAVRARTTEGGFLYERRHYAEAEHAWRAASDDAARANDEETRVRLANNLGHCAVQRGDYTTASAYFTTALVGFDTLGMEADRQRALWGFASILAKTDQVPEAIAQLNAVQADFLAREMVLDAALVTLAIVELLVKVDRVALFPSVCKNLVETFANAGMTANALIALAYLEECAHRRTVTSEEVERVRAFVHALADDPSAEFAA
jgi:tetratricopeptide (TPR) repeat protein